MLLVRMIELHLPNLHYVSMLILKHTGLYDAQAALDRAVKMENKRILEREGIGGGSDDDRERGSNMGGV